MKRVRLGLLAAVAMALVAGGCSTTAHATSPSTTAVPTARARAADQLLAHLGAGAPAGWKPVDEGNARVWVPSDWLLAGNGGCVGSAAGGVGFGPFPQSECKSTGPYTKTPWVALIPLSTAHTGKPKLEVHGYDVYDAHNPYRQDKAWTVYDVPQLRIRIATRGTLSSRILATLAPSARAVAIDSAYATAPVNSRAVNEDGVSLSVPQTWAAITPALWSCDLPIADGPALMLVKPGIEETCPDGVPPVQLFADGVIVYLTPHNKYAPSRVSRPVATLHHGSTTIAVYRDSSYVDALDLFVRRAGSASTHVLTLGLGLDGRTAQGVLASIRATA